MVESQGKDKSFSIAKTSRHHVEAFMLRPGSDVALASLMVVSGKSVFAIIIDQYLVRKIESPNYTGSPASRNSTQ